MKLENMLDIDLLQKHIENRLVGVQKHPTLPLVIYNYTQKAQFEHVWGDGTIDYCRGLIVDHSGYVVARPFKKFHNLDTLSIPETIQSNLPDVLPHVTEKMDGSLGILYRYNGSWGVSTRGSFTSPQAKWATDWYQKKIDSFDMRLLKTTNATSLFEIVYDENRIVCKYDFEGLILLGIVDNETGAEWDRKEVRVAGYAAGFVEKYIVKDYGNTNLATILSDNESNREGYVLTYDIGDQPPVKVKVKFEEYVKLHRVITGVSPKAIWDLLASGKDRSFIEDTPEHFKNWAEKWIDKLFDDFNLIFVAATDIYLTRPYRWVPDYNDEKVYRAHCAKYFKERAGATGMPNGVLGIVFAMLDGKQGKELDDMIWRLVKPRGDDKSFRTDGE